MDNPYKNRPHPVGKLKYSPRGLISQDLFKEALLEFGEVELIYDIPRIVGSGTYCNLGHARKGGSAFLLAQGLRDLKVEGHIFSVDVFVDKWGKKYHKSAIAIRRDSPLKEYLTLCHGTTDEWFEVFKQEGREFQFVFIDAGHDYLNIHSDWFNYKTLVPVGGYVAFHDTNQADAYKVLEEGPLNDSDWEEQKKLHINRIRVFKRVGDN